MSDYDIQKMDEHMEAGELEYNDLVERNNPPNDWDTPKWKTEDRVHNWRNYATAELILEWGGFTGRQKIIISGMLERIADSEVWD